MHEFDVQRGRLASYHVPTCENQETDEVIILTPGTSSMFRYMFTGQRIGQHVQLNYDFKILLNTT